MDEEQGFFIEGQHDLVPYVSGAIVAVLLLIIVGLSVKLIKARHELQAAYKEVVAAKMDRQEAVSMATSAVRMAREYCR